MNELEELLDTGDGGKTEDTNQVKWLWLKFLLGALAKIGGGSCLSFVGDEIAASTGWDASFVGSMLLAISTSMPELVVAISAFRMGAVDLAVADILGANMLDITYIFLLDLIYSRGLILSSVSGTHTITALIAILMTVTIIFGFRFKSRKKVFYFSSWYGVLLAGLYLFGAYALFAGVSF
jgi:cation:H+ antiporter